MPILHISMIFQNIATVEIFFTFSSHTEYVKRECIVFILYFYNFNLEILLNSEKRDRHLRIQIDKFYRFFRQII